MKIVYALIATVSFSALAQDAAKPQEAAKSVTPAPVAVPPVVAPAPPAEPAPLRLTSKDKLPTTVTQLITIDREPGDNKAKTAVARNAVLVHYTGWLYDPSKPDGKGMQFDSSVGRATPFGFIIGAGRVIKGWEQGVAGMKIKGKRTLIIPPQLAYGEAGRPPVIPQSATLMFDVELIDIVG